MTLENETFSKVGCIGMDGFNEVESGHIPEPSPIPLNVERLSHRRTFRNAKSIGSLATMDSLEYQPKSCKCLGRPCDPTSSNVPCESFASRRNRAMHLLRNAMIKSDASQRELQLWDKANGLPKSHCPSMVHSSRSRQQLLRGTILSKWDGTPLICKGRELGKPRKRRSLL